jgi:hypothetical protein
MLRPLLMTLALGFVVYAGWDFVRRWDSTSVKIAIAPLALSLLPMLGSTLIQARAWIVLIERMAGRRVAAGPAAALYLDSQLARYTPGKVGLPIVRMEGAGRIGVHSQTVGSSVLIEMLSWTAVGGSVGFLVLLIFGGDEQGIAKVAGQWAPLFLALSVVATLLLMTVDRARFPNRARKMLRLAGHGALVPVKLPLLHALYWLGWLAHGYLVTLALGADPSEALSASSFFVIATVAGFLALAAPAGIGVREGILYLGLAPAVGATPAATVALLSRGLSLVAEVSSWALLRPYRHAPAPE